MYLTPEENEEIIATLTLSRLRGLSQAQALAVVKYYGSATAALADDAPEEEHWRTLRDDKAALQTARDVALREIEFCENRQTSIIPYTSKDYPRLLRADEVADAPLQLFYCGTGSLNRRHIISVVGTRRITEYGKEMCEILCRELAEKLPDVLIVSGLAYGVDIHAHRAALVNNLDTIAVLAHGVDRIYPAHHRDTAIEMTRHGGLLTEYFTHTVPDKGNFVRRNRIVAGLSRATLVVESANKGGSLITANIAHSYSRDVLAVPGRATDAYSEGCNRLIREQRAVLVTSAADILDALCWESKEKTAAPKEPQLFPTFTPEQEQVLAVLRQADSLSLDQMAARAYMRIAQLTDILFDLEEADAVKRLPGNRYRVKHS